MHKVMRKNADRLPADRSLSDGRHELFDQVGRLSSTAISSPIDNVNVAVSNRKAWDGGIGKCVRKGGNSGKAQFWQTLNHTGRDAVPGWDKHGKHLVTANLGGALISTSKLSTNRVDWPVRS